MFVVNKADRAGVAETVRDLEMMLDLTGEMDVAAADRADGRDARRGHRRALGRDRRAPRVPGARPASSRGGARRVCATSCAAIVLARLREQADATRARASSSRSSSAQVAARELDPYAAAEELLGT